MPAYGVPGQFFFNPNLTAERKIRTVKYLVMSIQIWKFSCIMIVISEEHLFYEA